MKQFYIETFGCQMNVHDSEKVAGTLAAMGYSRTPRPEDADLVVYNTCSVREKAEQKVYSRLSQWKRTVGGRKFAVLGCVAQQEGLHIFDIAPHVGLVCGSASYPKLAHLIGRLESGEQRVAGLGLEAVSTFDVEHILRGNPHRAYITIMEGCDKACAYCVVPGTRGPERSRPQSSILQEARGLAESGWTEIQLLGQNVNSYRGGKDGLAGLLREIAEVPGLRRVRFTTSHPRDFERAIVEAIDAHPVLCDHVHLPVQSGSTRVLERMRRQYTRDDYMRCIGWLKQARRRIAMSTDIIVGFPGETEADFEDTMKLVEEVGFDSMFSFKYSPRPNTSALALDAQVPEEEKGRRLVHLQNRQRSIQIRRHAEMIGSVQEVMVEGFNQTTGQWIGRTSHNRVLNFTHPDADASLEGRYLLVRVTRAGANSLAGETANLV
jgi:tRNA-2-methylthio-N6-dimethylallyladenosine synthase